MFRPLWIVPALMLTATSSAAAQEKAADDKNAAASAKADKDAKADKGADAKEDATKQDAKADAGDGFQQQFAEWKELLAKLRTLRAQWFSAKPAERKIIEEEYAGLVKQGEEMEPKIIAGAEAAYAAAPDKDPEIGKFLAELVNEEVERDDYEPALKRAKLLIEHKYDNPRIYNLAGIAALATNDFDDARRYLEEAQKASSLDSTGQTFLSKIDECQELWEKEAELREAEAKTDDLPRVLLKTSKGDLVIELFENEAPNTVANFISLVEAGFYDGLAFHRVVPHFMAQGGDPKGDGTGGPGYTIPDEQGQPNHRNHFRGSLSMAKTNAPNSGGSQFFLMFRPSGPISSYDLNGKHAVFGRVIEGMNVLAKLTRTKNEKDEPTNKDPDTIVEAKVLRKRDHEYKVVKVGDPAASKKDKEAEPAADKKDSK